MNSYELITMPFFICSSVYRSKSNGIIMWTAGKQKFFLCKPCKNRSGQIMIP